MIPHPAAHCPLGPAPAPPRQPPQTPGTVHRQNCARDEESHCTCHFESASAHAALKTFWQEKYRRNGPLASETDAKDRARGLGGRSSRLSWVRCGGRDLALWRSFPSLSPSPQTACRPLRLHTQAGGRTPRQPGRGARHPGRRQLRGHKGEGVPAIHVPTPVCTTIDFWVLSAQLTWPELC